VVGIVNNRVGQIIALHRAAYGIFIGFSRKLGRMNPDDNHVIRERAFDTFQGWYNLDAIDATKGPEVQDYKPSMQIGQGQRGACIDPDKTFSCQFWGMNGCVHCSGSPWLSDILSVSDG